MALFLLYSTEGQAEVDSGLKGDCGHRKNYINHSVYKKFTIHT